MRVTGGMLAVLLLAGCGGASVPQSQSPYSSPEVSPTAPASTNDEAQWEPQPSPPPVLEFTKADVKAAPAFVEKFLKRASRLQSGETPEHWLAAVSAMATPEMARSLALLDPTSEKGLFGVPGVDKPEVVDLSPERLIVDGGDVHLLLTLIPGPSGPLVDHWEQDRGQYS